MSEPRRDHKQAWVVVFVLLSLLAHVLIVLAIILISLYAPKPDLTAHPSEAPSVTMSLEQPPPQASPPKQPTFLPSTPDPNAPPQKSPFESDNDNTRKSENRTARQPNSPLPDVTGKKHSLDLNTTPFVPKTEKPEVSSTPPTPQKPQKPEPQKPQQVAKQPPPPQPPTKPVDQAPPKPPTPQIAKTQFDPNGLPILPALTEQTVAPQDPSTATQQTQAQRPSAPAPSFQMNKSDVTGDTGDPGKNSASTMATELGRYKAKVYRAVGSRWYEKVGRQLQVLPVGTIHIQFTIHSDGTVDTTVLNDTGNVGALMLLRSISLNAITEAAPFDPFTETMKQQVGDSYTDDFSFSIYGG